jgi:cell division protease FtsH
VTFGRIEEFMFLGRDLMTEREYSEQVAQEIDAEVRRIMITAQKQAGQIINTRRKALEAIAEKLIKAETIEKEEFDSLIAEYKGRHRKKG